MESEKSSISAAHVLYDKQVGYRESETGANVLHSIDHDADLSEDEQIYTCESIYLHIL